MYTDIENMIGTIIPPTTIIIGKPINQQRQHPEGNYWAETQGDTSTPITQKKAKQITPPTIAQTRNTGKKISSTIRRPIEGIRLIY